MKPYPQVRLKPGKEKSLQRFHPWVFRGAIAEAPSGEGESMDGKTVRIISAKGRYLATGHFQQKGSIAVRAFSFEDKVIDRSFWRDKLCSALELRKKIKLFDKEQTNSYRLVHAEGDGMPGLIIDKYKETMVMQCHTTGMYLIREEIAYILKELFGNQLSGIYNKSESLLKNYSGVAVEDGYLQKPSSPASEITENGCRFHFDPVSGQKTGFFLDQRENRKLLAKYCEGKNVLNTFSYTGGFSIYALLSGAKKAVSVDSSESALRLAEDNAKLNGVEDKHEAVVSDVKEYFKNNAQKYDLIVLDPPAFAKHKRAKHQAVQAYKRLNSMAMNALGEGGFLFTFSCSQVVHKKLFRDTVMAAAIESGKEVKILHELSQPADHPVNIYHPEGDYLKGLVLYIQ